MSISAKICFLTMKWNLYLEFTNQAILFSSALRFRCKSHWTESLRVNSWSRILQRSRGLRAVSFSVSESSLEFVGSVGRVSANRTRSCLCAQQDYRSAQCALRLEKTQTEDSCADTFRPSQWYLIKREDASTGPLPIGSRSGRHDERIVGLC